MIYNLFIITRSLRISRPTKPKRRRAAEIVAGVTSDSVKATGEAGDGVRRVRGGDVTGEDSGVSITDSLEELETKTSLSKRDSWWVEISCINPLSMKLLCITLWYQVL